MIILKEILEVETKEEVLEKVALLTKMSERMELASDFMEVRLDVNEDREEQTRRGRRVLGPGNFFENS